MATFVQYLALKLAELNNGEWPEGCDEVEQSNYEIDFEGSSVEQENWRGEFVMAALGWECGGDFKYIEEYDSGETCTRAEYEEFMAAYPNYVQETLAARPEKVARIAELNKVAYAAVAEAMALSDEIGIPYTCSMPAGVADLAEFSDWDSSSC